MTIGIVATLQVKEGKNEEFESEFQQLAEKVGASEPGTLLYILHRSRNNPQEYKVFERYQDEEAQKSHMESDYFRNAQSSLGALLTAPPDIDVLDQV